MVDNALVAMYEAPRPQMEIPDVALDRHTRRGRALHRGWEHFWNEGAKLSNRAPELHYDPYELKAQVVRHDHQGVGHCEFCGHYGDDCKAKQPELV